MIVPQEELKKQLENVRLKFIESVAKRDKIVAEQTYELAAEVRNENIALQIEELRIRKEMAVNTQDYTMVAKFLDEQRNLQEKQKNT